jgi:hypothetical protein
LRVGQRPGLDELRQQRRNNRESGQAEDFGGAYGGNDRCRRSVGAELVELSGTTRRFPQNRNPGWWGDHVGEIDRSRVRTSSIGRQSFTSIVRRATRPEPLDQAGSLFLTLPTRWPADKQMMSSEGYASIPRKP